MDKTKQRIAIAEACLNHSLAVYRTSEGDINTGALPDYLNDLNAMHEAEKVLTDDQLYSMLLNVKNKTRSMVNGTAIMTASAAQRAEAFLRTLGKWEETITRKET